MYVNTSPSEHCVHAMVGTVLYILSQGHANEATHHQLVLVLCMQLSPDSY